MLAPPVLGQQFASVGQLALPPNLLSALASKKSLNSIVSRDTNSCPSWKEGNMYNFSHCRVLLCPTCGRAWNGPVARRVRLVASPGLQLLVEKSNYLCFPTCVVASRPWTGRYLWNVDTRGGCITRQTIPIRG
ncbi:hypothetical protein CONLIGDRAFT_631239, partial [Coniochaeta ligniaria NRRL 30616]